MLATNLKLISFPAPGPLGNITVTGRLGSQAKAIMGNNKTSNKFFMEVPLS
jgi:hypothetical protein